MKNKQIYIGLTSLVIGILYFLYQYDINIFHKIIDYWPIFILISGIFLQIVSVSNRDFKILFILSGMLIIYGIMYTIDMYKEFYYFSTHIAIFFLSLSLGLLNYYVFINKSNILLYFILMLTLVSIFIFTFPIYERYFPIISFKTVAPLLLMLLGFVLILNGFINKE